MSVTFSRGASLARAPLTFALALATFGPVAAQTPAEPAPEVSPARTAASANVTGLVLDESNALPIAGATVEFRSGSRQSVRGDDER